MPVILLYFINDCNASVQYNRRVVRYIYICLLCMCSVTQYWSVPELGHWDFSLLHSYSIVKLIQFQDFKTTDVLMLPQFISPIQIFPLNSRLIYPTSLLGCQIDILQYTTGPKLKFWSSHQSLLHPQPSPLRWWQLGCFILPEVKSKRLEVIPTSFLFLTLLQHVHHQILLVVLSTISRITSLHYQCYHLTWSHIISCLNTPVAS